MSDENTPNKKAEEKDLVKLYTDLTGSPESSARSVYMYLSPEGKEQEPEQQTKAPAQPVVGTRADEKA